MSPAPKANGEPLKRRAIADGLYVSKLEPDVIARVVQAIRAGATISTAADFAGISKPTYGRWLREGRNAIELGSTDENLRPQMEFVRAIDKALAELKTLLVGRIQQAGEGEQAQWTANAWVLERRFPDEYGRRQRVDHANADGQPFQTAAIPMFDPSRLSEEELAEAIRLMEKARPDVLANGHRSASKALPAPRGEIIEGTAEVVTDEPGEG